MEIGGRCACRRGDGLAGGVLESPGPARPEDIRPAGDYRNYMLLTPLEYRIGDGSETIVVPAGFVTDFASIPRPLWSLLAPNDVYTTAAIIHDYLYWTQFCTRAQADMLFYKAMVENDVPSEQRDLLYTAVSGGGSSSWQQNARLKASGYTKLVPQARWSEGRGLKWEVFQARLKTDRVTDPQEQLTGPAPSYCREGDDRSLPRAAGSVGKPQLQAYPGTYSDGESRDQRP